MSWSISILSRIVALIKWIFRIDQKIPNAEDYNAIIVGAGASGLQAGVSLDKAGFKNWVLQEKLIKIEKNENPIIFFFNFLIVNF